MEITFYFESDLEHALRLLTDKLERGQVFSHPLGMIIIVTEVDYPRTSVTLSCVGVGVRQIHEMFYVGKTFTGNFRENTALTHPKSCHWKFLV